MNKFRHLQYRVIAMFILLAFAVVPLLTRASASPQAATTLTINPVADAYVNASSPGTNYGTLTTLRVDGSPVVDSFLRFSVSGLTGASISQARLELHANSASTKGITVKAVANNTWGEKTIKYSNMPAMGATLAASAAVSSGAWVSLNVTSYISGNGTYSFGVITPGSTAISLSSRRIRRKCSEIDHYLSHTNIHQYTNLLFYARAAYLHGYTHDQLVAYTHANRIRSD